VKNMKNRDQYPGGEWGPLPCVCRYCGFSWTSFSPRGRVAGEHGRIPYKSEPASRENIELTPKRLFRSPRGGTSRTTGIPIAGE
jgi:hypothetical protein